MLFIILKTFVGKNNRAFPSLRYLGRLMGNSKTSMDPKTVIKYRDELIEADYIKVYKSRSENGKYLKCEYVLDELERFNQSGDSAMKKNKLIELSKNFIVDTDFSIKENVEQLSKVVNKYRRSEQLGEARLTEIINSLSYQKFNEIGDFAGYLEKIKNNNSEENKESEYEDLVDVD